MSKEKKVESAIKITNSLAKILLGEKTSKNFDGQTGAKTKVGPQKTSKRRGSDPDDTKTNDLEGIGGSGLGGHSNTGQPKIKYTEKTQKDIDTKNAEIKAKNDIPTLKNITRKDEKISNPEKRKKIIKLKLKLKRQDNIIKEYREKYKKDDLNFENYKSKMIDKHLKTEIEKIKKDIINNGDEDGSKERNIGYIKKYKVDSKGFNLIWPRNKSLKNLRTAETAYKKTFNELQKLKD